MPNPEDYKTISKAVSMMSEALSMLEPLAAQGGDSEGDSMEMETSEAGGDDKAMRMKAMEAKYSKVM